MTTFWLIGKDSPVTATGWSIDRLLLRLTL